MTETSAALLHIAPTRAWALVRRQSVFVVLNEERGFFNCEPSRGGVSEVAHLVGATHSASLGSRDLTRRNRHQRELTHLKPHINNMFLLCGRRLFTSCFGMYGFTLGAEEGYCNSGLISCSFGIKLKCKIKKKKKGKEKNHKTLTR